LTSSIRTVMGGIVTRLLGIAGLARDTLSLQAALKRCRQRGPDIGTVIDIGASNGNWSLKARKFFPEADFFLVEAQSAHEKALSRAKARNSWMDYIISAAGDRDGEISFDASDPFGGVASHSKLENDCIIVPMTTIDTLVQKKGLRSPFLLKLDTHGFELPIFVGARETLRQTALVVIETYNFNLTSDSLRFHEMCTFLESRGFRCIDLCEPMHRPGDGAFWQVDLFFVPAGREEFKSNTYE
jgi:FkbM family methyltransferase